MFSSVAQALWVPKGSEAKWDSLVSKVSWGGAWSKILWRSLIQKGSQGVRGSERSDGHDPQVIKYKRGH